MNPLISDRLELELRVRIQSGGRRKCRFERYHLSQPNTTPLLLQATSLSAFFKSTYRPSTSKTPARVEQTLLPSSFHRSPMIRPTLALFSKASRVPLTSKGGNKEFYKGPSLPLSLPLPPLTLRSTKVRVPSPVSVPSEQDATDTARRLTYSCPSACGRS